MTYHSIVKLVIYSNTYFKFGMLSFHQNQNIINYGIMLLLYIVCLLLVVLLGYHGLWLGQEGNY